jgi:[ribosomal protein S5]-alanine N-acetyltransferase
MRVLQAEPLVLEPLEGRHAPGMFSVLSDPAIYEYENEPPPSLEWLAERYRKLESRTSADGAELWLNWVVIFGAAPIGYVQATIESSHTAWIAYEFASAYWGRGWATLATGSIIEELEQNYGVATLLAELVGANHRSRRLLERHGFELADPALQADRPVEPGEILMVRRLAG